MLIFFFSHTMRIRIFESGMEVSKWRVIPFKSIRTGLDRVQLIFFLLEFRTGLIEHCILTVSLVWSNIQWCCRWDKKYFCTVCLPLPVYSLGGIVHIIVVSFQVKTWKQFKYVFLCYSCLKNKFVWFMHIVPEIFIWGEEFTWEITLRSEMKS